MTGVNTIDAAGRPIRSRDRSPQVSTLTLGIL